MSAKSRVRKLSRKVFNDREKEAIWTAHGEKCWLCERSVDLLEMEVDHAIPVDLQGQPKKFAEAKLKLGLTSSFEIESFENWRPSHRKCNGEKREAISFAPAFVLSLERGIKKGQRAREIAAKLTTNRSVSRALATIRAAAESKFQLSAKQEEILRSSLNVWGSFHEEQREPELKDQPIRLSPLYTVLSKGALFTMVRGPYGIGGGPTGPDVAPGMRCPSCGGIYFNGARCVTCGAMDDD